MVLDIQLFRDQPDLVRESQKRRYKPTQVVEDIIALDQKLKQLNHEEVQLLTKRKQLQTQIDEKRKAGQDFQPLIAEKKEAEKKAAELNPEQKKLEQQLQSLLSTVGNIVHDSVTVHDNEDNNGIVRTWGKFETSPEKRHHHKLLAMIDGYDPERGAKVVGHRGYFLKGVGVQLNMAIIQYGIDFLLKREYTLLQPPLMMNKEPMSQTAQLEQFDEELYKVDCSSTKDTEKEDDKYLIATSEQPISAFHQGEWLDPKSLPLRYGGVSTCFRKEAGNYGKDNWGIFRVHQFDKIEQFVITSPEDSWKMHETMLQIAEEFYQSLGIPYRVVNIVSGALNNAAAKKYDLEGWFPSFNTFRELVSCSNCTDYQSRSLGIRFGSKTGGEKAKFVHMLNSTLCATTRTICAVLENYQTADGVNVPEALQPYMGGKKFLPFVIQEKDLPKPKGEAKPKANKDNNNAAK